MRPFEKIQVQDKRAQRRGKQGEVTRVARESEWGKIDIYIKRQAYVRTCKIPTQKVADDRMIIGMIGKATTAATTHSRPGDKNPSERETEREAERECVLLVCAGGEWGNTHGWVRRRPFGREWSFMQINAQEMVRVYTLPFFNSPSRNMRSTSCMCVCARIAIIVALGSTMWASLQILSHKQKGSITTNETKFGCCADHSRPFPLSWSRLVAVNGLAGCCCCCYFVCWSHGCSPCLVSFSQVSHRSCSAAKRKKICVAHPSNRSRDVRIEKQFIVCLLRASHHSHRRRALTPWLAKCAIRKSTNNALYTTAPKRGCDWHLRTETDTE